MTEDAFAQPTVDDLRVWRDEVLSEWSVSDGTLDSLDLQVSAEEDAYFQNFNVKAPKEQWIVKTGSAPADCDAVVDTLVPTDVLIKVRPARTKEKYQKQAEKLVKFAKALLHSWRQKKDTIRMIVTDMVIRRVGVARVLVDDRLWPAIPARFRKPELSDDDVNELDDWEALHRRKCPIILERRNPRHVRWRMDENDNLLVVVEQYTTTVLEASITYDQYPASKRILAGRDLKDSIIVDDVWFGNYRCIFLDDQPVFPGEVVKHGYFGIPYIIAPFRELTFDEPGKRYRGMLSNSAGLYTIEAEVLTMETWMLAFNAWRTYIGHFVGGNKTIEVVPGQYIDVDKNKNEYLELLEGRPVPPELLQFAAVIDSYIQRNGVAQGPRSVEGTRSGAQVWAIQSQRQLKIESAKQSLQRFLQLAFTLGAMHLDTVLKESVTLPVPGVNKDGEDQGEVKIGPRDIDGYWDGFEVSFGQRLDPALLEQNLRLADLVGKGYMPWLNAVEAGGMTDAPHEWYAQMIREKVNNLPFMYEAAAMEQMASWWGEDHWKFLLFLQKIMEAKQQPVGGPGMPTPGAQQPLAFSGGGDTAQNQGGFPEVGGPAGGGPTPQAPPAPPPETAGGM